MAIWGLNRRATKFCRMWRVLITFIIYPPRSVTAVAIYHTHTHTVICLLIHIVVFLVLALNLSWTLYHLYSQVHGSCSVNFDERVCGLTGERICGHGRLRHKAGVSRVLWAHLRHAGTP